MRADDFIDNPAYKNAKQGATYDIQRKMPPDIYSAVAYKRSPQEDYYRIPALPES